MSERPTAEMFKALGEPTRLHIFEFLRGCCCPVALGESGEVIPIEGPTAGEVCCHVTGAEKITSAISFHLKELRNAGLIQMDKRGKHMVCAIDQASLRSLNDYFSPTKESSPCCAGEQS